VNPGAAEAKPKVQVAKKANILSQLPPQAEQPAAQTRPAAQPVQQPKATARQADDDLGIVRMERPARQQPARGREPSPPQAAPNPMIPKQSVSHLNVHIVHSTGDLL